MKRLISVFLILLILVPIMNSCGSEGVDINDFSKPNDDKNIINVYSQYTNLVKIGAFNNGLASFLIHNPSPRSHMGVLGSWSGDYYYGFIDTKGHIVIEPTFECNPFEALPIFEYNFIKPTNISDNECIIDKKGKVQFKVGENSVTAIGKVSEGYFWVETVEEYVSGNEYTVRYYSANDLSVVATFENIRAIPDNMTIGQTNSTLSSTGEGKLAYKLNQYSWSDDDLVVFNIKDYDNKYAPKQDNWNVDLSKVKDFASASLVHHVSSIDNEKGQLASVALRNTNGTWFYSVVDNKGNVLMKPQQNIAFVLLDKTSEIDKYDFCKDLCPAKDIESGFWGYIDPYGKWQITPQYSSVTAFSADGYAIVNDKIVINTEGKVVLAPKGWTNSVVTNLSGKYKNTVNGNNWYLEFGEDGSLKITQSFGGAGTITSTGKYQIKGGTLIVSGFNSVIGCPGIPKEGEYALTKEGNTIYIGESKWIAVI